MLELTVKTLDSQNHSFSCEDDITVRGFKEHIADTVNVPVESQRLIYCGRVLQDDKKLNDYGNVNGKVIHLVQRAPPQPESRNSSYSDGQRQINEPGWMSLEGWTSDSPHRELGGSRLQYRGHLHRNAMYLGSMSVPPEVVEGLPAPQLSNTLSNSRLVAAKRMLTKANQLMDRMDDPSVPLHPSPTENTAPPPQASAPEEESEQNSNVNSNESNARSRNILVQAASEAASVAAAFSAAALINIRLSQDNSENGGNASGSVTVIDASRPEPTASAQPQESGAGRPQPQSSQAGRSETASAEPGRSGTERREQSRSDASTSNSDNQSTSRRSTPQVPRPSEMANVLGQLLSTQNRLTPYLERYRLLMETDPALTPGSGPEGVTENQRIVDGVSETLHFLSHACHTLSDIIVDMGQQPPRNLRCRPIVIQHSAILQAGIPIQVESHINLRGRNTGNNNNATDEGNEATRPSSPTSGTSDQSTSRPAVNIRTINPNANGQQNQPSLLGTLLNLPTNVELSMELSPQSTMDLSSPSQADGSENEQGQSNNNNNNSNAEGAGNFHWINPSMALIRDALESALNERHSQMDTSTGSATNTPTNIPFVTIAGQQTMDLGTPNSGQSTQARSNIGTHPTTSTQTRSTARPHVLHPHTHPLNVGVGMGQSLDFDPFLPCNSHHIRRNPPVTVNTTSTSQSNQANQATSENSNRSQTAPRSTTSTRNTSPGSTLTLTRLDNERALASGIGLAMTFRELLQAPSGGDVHISLVGSGPNSSEIELSPDSDLPLSELLRSMNLRVNEFAGQNFLIDLWLFLLRNFTLGHLMELTLGGSTPLINLRRPLREFLEHSFPNLSRESLQERVVEEIVSNSRTYLDSSLVPETEIISNRRVNIPATFEAMLRKFCTEFLQLLLNNDLSNTTFALEAFALTKKLEEQTSAVFQHILQGGQIALETITSRFVTQLTEGINDPFFQHTLVDDLIARFRAYGSRTTQMTPEEINALLVYQDEPSAPPAETEDMESSPAAKSEAQPEPQEGEEGAAAAATVAEEVDQAQALPLQEPIQAKAELQEEETDTALEPMETEPLHEKPDDPMDLAFGQDIPETFPGAEYLPPEWVPIIARDTVRQRRQSELEKLQGGPIPFSDAYLSCMPSKRRKLIEQQKPQILASPTPANTMPIPASVERLVREGIAHSQLEEAEGAASAVAATPAVRNAFGQAIKDCLHPGRLKTPDFPNSRRFPNASRLFAGDGDSKDKEAATTTKKSAASMSPSAASTTQTSK